MQQSQLLVFDVFRGIASFLSIKDLLNLLQRISRQMKENVQLALKALLAQIGLNNPNTTTPYNIIFQNILCECQQNLIQIGLTYTGILTIQKSLYICLPQEYQKITNHKPNFIKSQVKQFSTASKGKFIYQKENGNLNVVFEDLEEYQIVKVVEFFETSYSQLSVIFTNPQQNIIITFQIKQSHSLLIIRSKILELWSSTKNTNKLLYQKKKEKQFNILSDKTQKIYSSDTKNEQIIDPIIKTVHQNYFDKRSIISIYSGLNYFLALGRKKIKSIKEWTNEELQIWLNKNGFSGYVNIVKYNEYTGQEFSKQAVNQDFKKIHLDLLMLNYRLNQATELTRAMEFQYKDYQLFSWGKNDFGQLSAPQSNNLQYAKVSLPNLEEDDEILQIECGWKNVAILTHSRKLYQMKINRNTTKEIRNYNNNNNNYNNNNNNKQQDEGGKKRKKVDKNKKILKTKKNQNNQYNNNNNQSIGVISLKYLSNLMIKENIDIILLIQAKIIQLLFVLVLTK